MILAVSDYTVPVMHADNTDDIYMIIIVAAMAIGFSILCTICSEAPIGRKINDIVGLSFMVVFLAAIVLHVFTSMFTIAYINTSSLKKSSGAVFISANRPDHDRIFLAKNHLTPVIYVKDGMINDGLILMDNNGKAGLFDDGSGKTAMKPVLSSNHHDNTLVKRTRLQEKDGIYNIPFDDIARDNHVSNLIPLASRDDTVYASNGDQSIDVKYVRGTSMYDGTILIIDGYASLYQPSEDRTHLIPVLK